MNFTVLGPSDGQLAENKSDMTDGRFGGHREHSNVAKASDYTSRTGTNANKKENPVDDAVKDVDDMSNSTERKSEFSYQEEKMDVSKGNEADWQTKSDSDNRPRMDEGSEAVQTPNATPPKRHRKPNQWQLGTESVYDGEIR